MTTRVDVVVIGGGHNGLVCACYLARAGLAVTVLEASETAGGCIHTVDLPDGRGRFELGAHEHGGIRGSGVAADLELEARFGLRFHLREEVTLAPCDDGTALAFHDSLDQTVEGLATVVSRGQAEAYRRFARWAAAGVALLRQVDAGPPPSLSLVAGLSRSRPRMSASRRPGPWSRRSTHAGCSSACSTRATSRRACWTKCAASTSGCAMSPS